MIAATGPKVAGIQPGKERRITPTAATLETGIDAPALPAIQRGAAGAWALAQAARDPYIILITIYIFAPYYVTRVMGDPVAGQTLVAGANKWGGWIVMLTAPLLGATIDRLGPRKPWLAGVITLMIAMITLLWFTPPGGGLTPLMVGTILAVMTVAFAYHEMLHNALLVPAAGLSGAARASGLGLAGGNAVSVLMLVGVLVAFALPGKVGWSWLPAAPLWGLDPALGEPDRITTLIVAVTMALFSIPLFLKVPDMARSALGVGAAFRAGAGDLAALFKGARGHRNVLTYLLARMIFTDGMTAILVFGGLFAAGTMQWATLEMLAYGITLSIAAVAGGLLAGRLDDAVGPKTSLKIELSLLMIFEGLALGMGRHRMFYQPWDGAPLWNAPMFTTLPELVFLGLGCVIAITITAAYASSRTMLTRVAPPDQLGVFFGLYVLSGAATMWLGPLLIEAATRAGGSQSIGLTPILGMLGLGLALLFAVRGGGPVK